MTAQCPLGPLNPYKENAELRPIIPVWAQHVESLGVLGANYALKMGPHVSQLVVLLLHLCVSRQDSGAHGHHLQHLHYIQILRRRFSLHAVPTGLTVKVHGPERLLHQLRLVFLQSFIALQRDPHHSARNLLLQRVRRYCQLHHQHREALGVLLQRQGHFSPPEAEEGPGDAAAAGDLISIRMMPGQKMREFAYR